MSEDRITQRTVTVVMGIIAALAFVFSFGNVWALALRLGVPGPIAPLIAPMVDLSVVGLLVALRYLSLRGVPAEQIKGATRLMHMSGLLTLALNVAEPIVAGHYGRAAVDAVAPLLLLGWGAVGPQLLRHFHTVATTTPAPAPAAPDAPAEAPAPKPAPASESVPPPVTPKPETSPAVTVPVPLLNAARTIADTYRAEHGEPISPAQLRARLGVALPLATAAHAQL
ncbi:DUF2637 domain-containing protein [Streptomyces sp. 5-10]|uniref:DUF2637 domain-containing protein n=1 Tax=Streptomyces sp. 5-10 TaxID=878925 RepID=UPI00168A4779|nr:DUF2637 domain-containing protein [Streptomyces sp. 5-10]MBD3011359.1 DUF2637 domain-containing protein [Streptomyces sp. 5-10]